MYPHGHNHTEATEIPDTPAAHHWRMTLPAVSLTFGILASLVFALRVYASRFASCKIRAEDVIMGVGVVLMWGTVTSVLLKAYSGIGVPGWQIPVHLRQMQDLGSFLIPKFWAGSTACCKVAIALFLHRVVGFTRPIKVTLITITTLTVAWALVVILFSTFTCKPVSFYWNKSGHNGHCKSRRAYNNGNIALSVISMVTDIVLLIIPMPTLWRSQMRKSQKIAMTAVLGIGLVVCVFTVLRVIEFLYFDLNHISESSGLETLWTILENEFSVICGCAPQLAPLFRSLRTSSKTKSSGYAGMFDTSVLGRHTKMSVIKTTVSFTGGNPMPGMRLSTRETRSSSEVELKGIEVHTAINQEISAEGRQHTHHSERSSTAAESGSYTRI